MSNNPKFRSPAPGIEKKRGKEKKTQRLRVMAATYLGIMVITKT